MSNLRQRADTVGLVLSSACALHCLLLPVVITVLPLLGLGVLAGEAFEIAMLLITVPLASLCLLFGIIQHRQFRILLLLFAAIGLFALGFDHHGQEAHVEGELHSETLLFALGGLFLATAHWLNRRLCKSCPSCSH